MSSTAITRHVCQCPQQPACVLHRAAEWGAGEPDRCADHDHHPQLTPTEALATALAHRGPAPTGGYGFIGQPAINLARAILAALTNDGWHLTNETTLDEAWRAAEAALPEGWRLEVGTSGVIVGYFADALRRKSDAEWAIQERTLGPTPQAALLALAEKLR